MLSRLSVNNLAIVEKTSLEFSSGLNVITGETGSGKSVLMNALGLALGARADKSMVRDGANDARIEAEFTLDNSSVINSILDDSGLPSCEDGILLIRRIIGSESSGRVYVNDSQTTVQTLRKLGRAIVDIYGPDDHLSILEEKFQREALDSFGHINKSEYSKIWVELGQLSDDLERLLSDTSDFEAEKETLRFQIDEIDSAALSEDDEDFLTERHASAAHAAEIVEASGAATLLMTGDGESAANFLAESLRNISSFKAYHPDAENWCQRLESSISEIQDISRDIDDAVSKIDADPESLATLDERISLVRKLKRKYAPSIAGILELRDKKLSRLEELESRDSRIKDLQSSISGCRAKLAAAGKRITAARKKASTELSASIVNGLKDLGFLKSDLSITISPCEPTASGCDEVCFMFRPNPGEKARALKDIASSGETARVMLAIKAVIAEHDSIPVVVFDEIDSNIGGAVGKTVGRKLRSVAKHRQVIAITHLPQSAVYGEKHFAVSKHVIDGRTKTQVRELSGDERVREIARMLSGKDCTDTVKAHALELLESSANDK